MEVAEDEGIQRATVSGLELMGMQRGYYLKCDQCGATLGVEAVPSMKHQASPRDWRKLQEYAREIGWTGPLSHEYTLPVAERAKDRCPSCAAAEHGPT